MNEEFQLSEKLSLITVDQIPIIFEHLDNLQSVIEERTAEALSYECTEENYKEVKKIRAALNKERAAVKERYEEAMDIVLRPINAVQEKFKKCDNVYKQADLKLKNKINSVENNIKGDKRAEIEAYFEEYALSKNIDFLTFDMLGVSVTMSASMKAMQKSVKDMIDRIECDLKLIDMQEDKEEVLIEYKKHLNVANAISSVKARKAAVAEEKRKETERQVKQQAERQAVLKVEENLSPPTVQEKILKVRFTAYGTREQLKGLKAFMEREGIRYE